jgi:N-ethylmaleimide reductase
MAASSPNNAFRLEPIMPTTFTSPLTLGALTLPNRIVMAPLTRLRNSPAGVPTPLAATYYAQRAGAGLIISEATCISPTAVGYPGSPGIHSAEQIAAWRTVTDAVHAAGGRIALQLWHVGRISHPSLQPGGALPVAPSAIAAEGMAFTAQWGQEPFPVPRALTTEEIPALVADFVHAAQQAQVAGFDAVEVHGANGYLLDQFLQDGSNRRTDAYGGSIVNRMRLLLEVVDAVRAVWGADRVGVRLSPYGTFNSMHDGDPVALFTAVVQALDARRIAYVHLIEPRSGDAGMVDTNRAAPSARRLFRPHFRGALLSAGGYDRAEALASLGDGSADAVVFGRLYISNPDLAERLARDAPLARYDRATFYGSGAAGYTDYPSLTASARA